MDIMDNVSIPSRIPSLLTSIRDSISPKNDINFVDIPDWVRNQDDPDDGHHIHEYIPPSYSDQTTKEITSGVPTISNMLEMVPSTIKKNLSKFPSDFKLPSFSKPAPKSESVNMFMILLILIIIISIGYVVYKNYGEKYSNYNI